MTLEVVEIPVVELQDIFDELRGTYNLLNDLLKEHGILRGRELAEMNTRAMNSIKTEETPTGKIRLVIAFIRKQISFVNNALKARPPAKGTGEGTIRQAITKIQLRALSLIEHVKTISEGRKEVALNSSQARQFLAGREGKAPSRRDAIRALRRAEKICPALVCAHTPNDGRQTMRLTAKTEDLNEPELIKTDIDRSKRQRSKMDEAMVILGFKTPRPEDF